MFRILNAVSVIALLAAAGVVYQVKYSAAFEAQQIAKLRDEIRGEKDRIALLNAEWARRTSPSRIQALAEHHLDMQPLDVDHMDRLASLPAKPDVNGDPLAGMIEALVDGPNPNPAARSSAAPAAKPAPAKAAKPGPVRLPADAPLAESTGPGLSEPLPLSDMPAAGNMGSNHARFTGPQGTVGSVDPAASHPLLPSRGDER